MEKCMTTTKMTLSELLRKTSDAELICIEEELLTGIVPSTGYSHNFCRKVNKMIDKGELCINPTTYRKVYLPTMARAVQRELSHRYVEAIRIGGLKCADR